MVVSSTSRVTRAIDPVIKLAVVIATAVVIAKVPTLRNPMTRKTVPAATN